MIERGTWYLANVTTFADGGDGVGEAKRRRVLVTGAGQVFVTHTSGDASRPPGEMGLIGEDPNWLRARGCFEPGRGRARRTYEVEAVFSDLVPE